MTFSGEKGKPIRESNLMEAFLKQMKSDKSSHIYLSAMMSSAQSTQKQSVRNELVNLRILNDVYKVNFRRHCIYCTEK